jgi:hypothetical protein
MRASIKQMNFVSGWKCAGGYCSVGARLLFAFAHMLCKKTEEIETPVVKLETFHGESIKKCPFLTVELPQMAALSLRARSSQP